jgi:hypothetical protein
MNVIQDADSEYQWREFEDDANVKLPPGPHRKARFYADASIPRQIVEEFRAHGLDMQWAHADGIGTHPDGNIYGKVRRRGYLKVKSRRRVLLTMDRDFWDDREYPLQDTPGVIFVDLPPDQVGRAIDGLARCYALFIEHFPGDWWTGVKVRVTEHSFAIRCRTWDGNCDETEYRVDERGKLLQRRRR